MPNQIVRHHMTQPFKPIKQGKHTQLGNALLAEVNQLTIDSLISHNIDASTADQIANHLRNTIASSWGGQLIYIPKDFQAKLTDRDTQIYAEFNGKNHSELATKYNLTIARIYEIIKTIRKKKQPDLFE